MNDEAEEKKEDKKGEEAEEPEDEDEDEDGKETPTHQLTLSAGNISAIFALALESFQLATFALQSESSEEDDGGVILPEWAPKLAKIGYGSFLTQAGSFTPVDLSWCAIGAVALLLLIFALQFLLELRSYGLYLIHGNDAAGRD